MKEKLYLLGHPVAHSKSPVMHNALYQKLGLDWHYDRMDCADQEEARRFIEGQEYLGINITTPYKPLAFSCADIKAASAELARGANVLASKASKLIGYNVDGLGCVSFLEQKGFPFAKATVVICGTGPTSFAIAHAAALAGASKVMIIGRESERAQAALDRYREELATLASATIALPPMQEGHRSLREVSEQVAFSSGSYAECPQVFAEADLIVNATPMGMAHTGQLPFDTDLLHAGQTIYDVVYGQGETKLVAAARAQGCTAYDGSGMLVAQAVASDRIFFEIASVDLDMSDEEMFAIMAHAAGFE